MENLFIFSNKNRSQNKSYVIDAREAAPSTSHQDMFVDRPLQSRYGGTASYVLYYYNYYTHCVKRKTFKTSPK
jgi:hypothetical protein